MLNLIYDNIFTRKSDLLVVPCDTNGCVTYQVYKSIYAHNYPMLNKSMLPGDIEVFKCNECNLHKYIAYVASVEEIDGWTTADLETISTIINKIKIECKRLHIKTINLPLLGTGAGGLSPQEVYMCIKDEVSNSNLVFNLIAFTEKTYDNLIKKDEIEPIEPPRVFISYASDDIKIKNWAIELARKLRNNGVNAIIDEFHLPQGTDLRPWMTKEIKIANKVILICDTHYVRKANESEKGVGWETRIIMNDINLSDNTIKYIPIVKTVNFQNGLLNFMDGRFSFHWVEDIIDENSEKFKRLLYVLYDCEMAPPVKETPNFILDKLKK